MSKFTPGPWHAGADARIVYDAAGWAIANAIVFHGKHGATEAYGNGRLIAAAPDMLAMLVEAHDIIDAIGQPETAEVAARMLATIAKAEGGGMSLPYDTARCAGHIDTSPTHGEIMRHECINCLCRTSYGRDQWQSHIAPHDGEGPCPMRIGPMESE